MSKINSLDEFLNSIPDPEHRDKFAALMRWIQTEFPELNLRIAWNQPMFTAHGTFIIGFSVAKNHISASVEDFGLDHFRDTITQAGYTTTKRLFQMQWDQPWSHDLLSQLIAFNLTDKQNITSFWRKA